MDRQKLPFRLSPRQYEVLDLVVQGRSNKEIAAALHIKEGSVKAHIHAILRTMQVASRAEVIATVERHRASAVEQETARRIGEREQFLEGILKSIADGVIVIDSTGRVGTCNPAAARMFGYSPEEIIGRNVAMLMPEPHAGEHAGYMKTYAETGTGKIVGRGVREVMGRRKDGVEFPVDISIGEMDIGGNKVFIGTIRVDNMRQKIQAALHQSEMQLRRVIDAISACIAYIDRDHRIRFANNYIQMRHKMSHDELIGMHLKTLWGAEFYERQLPGLNRAFAGETVVVEGEQWHGDGRKYRTTRMPHFNDAGEAQGILVFVIPLNADTNSEIGLT
jgi:PAS domain S-box-containing protein